MIATVGRSRASTAQGSGAPQFAVQFSRPRSLSGRTDSRLNSFRWTGPGTIHILERGMLVLTRRRSPLGFRTADERFVAAAEICEVFREGDSVRVDLRGDGKAGGFFQFWTGNPAIAGTIVRLLPTTRTIEYEEAASEPTPSPRPPLSLHRRRRAQRRFLSAALIVGLVVIGALLITDIALRRSRPHVGPHAVIVTEPPDDTVASKPPSAAMEIADSLAELRHADDRMDGLRAQYRTAALALQSGQMSRDDFISGINKWFLPQWRALYRELAAKPHDSDSLSSLVRKRLIASVLDWERGLQDYADGLQANDYDAVIAAFGHMSDGSESRRDAWRLVERAEFDLASTSSSPRTP